MEGVTEWWLFFGAISSSGIIKVSRESGNVDCDVIFLTVSTQPYGIYKG